MQSTFNRCSNPSELRITDMRFVDIDGAPKRCTIIKIMTIRVYAVRVPVRAAVCPA